MFDNLDFTFVAIIHYGAMVALLLSAFVLLRRTKGCSLLGISAITLSLQVGYYFGWLPDYVAQGPGRVYEPAFTRLGIALTLYYCITGLAIAVSLITLPREGDLAYSKPAMRPGIIIGAVLLAVLFILFRSRSGAAALVLNEGTDVLGGDAYYDLRAELIDVQTAEGYSRLASHFEHLSRKFLFMMLITCSYFFGLHRQWQLLALLGALTATLLFDEFIRFQKAPMMFVLGGAILPALMFWSTGSGKQSWRGKIPRWLLGGAILFGLAGWIAVITMAVPIGEVVEFVKNRFFVIPPYTSSMYFYVYPETNPHVHFSTIRLVSSLFGIPPLTYSGAVSVDVAEAISGLRYNANACMVADGWANWGYAGVIGVSMAASLVFLAMDHYLRSLRARMDVTPLLLFFWTCVVSFGNTAFLNIVISNALWFVPFIYPLVFTQSRIASEVESTEASPPESDGTVLDGDERLGQASPSTTG